MTEEEETINDRWPDEVAFRLVEGSRMIVNHKDRTAA
jgi:hypothetical protein